uniref:Uncharacterized protein n=1 Tax=Rhizophora mucronata TaxID=61149 RepID=A0A2P2J037_RHIMU
MNFVSQEKENVLDEALDLLGKGHPLTHASNFQVSLHPFRTMLSCAAQDSLRVGIRSVFGKLQGTCAKVITGSSSYCLLMQQADRRHEEEAPSRTAQNSLAVGILHD